MSTTLYQMLASAMPWLVALLRAFGSRLHGPPDALDDADLAQRVRLSGEW